MSIRKEKLVSLRRAELENRLQSLDATQSAARAGTRVDGSHRPENRGERAAVTSQGYLAHGLQQRMDDLAQQLRLVDEMGSGPRNEVVVGAWLSIEDEREERQQIAIFPGGDATILLEQSMSIQVLSPSSPLLQPLMGLEEGDGAVLRGLGEVEIVWIR